MPASIVAKFKQDSRTLALKETYFDNLNLKFKQEAPSFISHLVSRHLKSPLGPLWELKKCGNEMNLRLLMNSKMQYSTRELYYNSSSLNSTDSGIDCQPFCCKSLHTNIPTKDGIVDAICLNLSDFDTQELDFILDLMGLVNIEQLS